MNKAKPRDIAVDSRAGALVIAWSNGRESRYNLAELRRACPCAHCRELRDADEGGLTLLQPEAASATAEVRGVSLVGRYGLRIEWADGHDHGIYTFEFFRGLDAGG